MEAVMSERVLVIERKGLIRGLSDNKFYPEGAFSEGLEHIYYNDRWKGILPSYSGVYMKHILQYGFFMPRDEAEDEEKYLQIIPYATIRCNDRLLTYRRTPEGGEERLHEKLSVGVGGHVNTDDLTKALSRPPHSKVYAELAMLQGIERELREELRWKDESPWLITNGPLIYDGTNDVGRVHLGVVLEIVSRSKEQISLKTQEGLADIQWNTLSELAELDNKLEGWSSLYVQYKKNLEEKICRPS